jgi:hypothetical protein
MTFCPEGTENESAAHQARTGSLSLLRERERRTPSLDREGGTARVGLQVRRRSADHVGLQCGRQRARKHRRRRGIRQAEDHGRRDLAQQALRIIVRVRRGGATGTFTGDRPVHPLRDRRLSRPRVHERFHRAGQDVQHPGDEQQHTAALGGTGLMIAHDQ